MTPFLFFFFYPAGSFFTGQSSKNNEEVSLIRKADLENHNKDGGFWTVIDGKVYDIKDFQAQSQSLAGNSVLGKSISSPLEEEKRFFIEAKSLLKNVFFSISQPSLQERTRWLLWKLLYSLRTLESPCRPSALDSTWRYQRSLCMFPTPFFLAFITHVRFSILEYSFLDSRTRRPSLLRTSVVFPRR